MSTNNTYLAVFLGSKTSSRRAAWDSLSEGDRRKKEREGIAAWKGWAEKHHAVIVTMGGPLGKTKGSRIRAMPWALLRLYALTPTKPPPGSSTGIRTSPFSRATPSRSCPCCPSLATSDCDLR